jgi:hypothetical protein
MIQKIVHLPDAIVADMADNRTDQRPDKIGLP